MNDETTADNSSPLWIKDPLAIFADEAQRGIVVQDGRIAELVPGGQTPETPDVKPLMPARMWCCRG